MQLCGPLPPRWSLWSPPALPQSLSPSIGRGNSRRAAPAQRKPEETGGRAPLLPLAQRRAPAERQVLGRPVAPRNADWDTERGPPGGRDQQSAIVVVAPSRSLPGKRAPNLGAVLSAGTEGTARPRGLSELRVRATAKCSLAVRAGPAQPWGARAGAGGGAPSGNALLRKRGSRKPRGLRAPGPLIRTPAADHVILRFHCCLYSPKGQLGARPWCARGAPALRPPRVLPEPRPRTQPPPPSTLARGTPQSSLTRQVPSVPCVDITQPQPPRGCGPAHPLPSATLPRPLLSLPREPQASSGPLHVPETRPEAPPHSSWDCSLFPFRGNAPQNLSATGTLQSPCLQTPSNRLQPRHTSAHLLIDGLCPPHRRRAAEPGLLCSPHTQHRPGAGAQSCGCRLGGRVRG